MFRQVSDAAKLPELVGLTGLAGVLGSVTGKLFGQSPSSGGDFEIISLAGVVSVLFGFLWAVMQWFRALQTADRDRIKHLEAVVEQQNARVLEYSDRFREILLQAGERAFATQQTHGRQVERQQDQIDDFEEKFDQLIEAILSWARNKPACLAGKNDAGLKETLEALQEDQDADDPV